VGKYRVRKEYNLLCGTASESYKRIRSFVEKISLAWVERIPISTRSTPLYPSIAAPLIGA
jgi:hypothetical protein